MDRLLSWRSQCRTRKILQFAAVRCGPRPRQPPWLFPLGNMHFTQGQGRCELSRNHLGLKVWIYSGCFSLWIVFMCAIGLLPNTAPWVYVGAVAIVVSSVVLYTLPSVIACATKHPSRTAICFVNWFLGWTILGWLIAMIWSLAGLDARRNALVSVAKPVPDVQGSATEPTPVPEETIPIDMERLRTLAQEPVPGPTKVFRNICIVGGVVLVVAVITMTPLIQFMHRPATIVNIVDGPDYLKAKSASPVHAPSAVSSPAPASLTGDRQAVKWTAMSHTAYAITGDVVTSRDSISLLKKSYPLVLDRDLHGDELQNSAKLLYVEAVTSSGLVGRLFRTEIPATTHLINDNTICGSENAEWVLVLTTHAEGRGSDTGDWLYLAFFSGDAEPVFQTQALENSKALCGTYNYQMDAAPQVPAPVENSKQSVAH